jgi:Ca2+-binding RTX toxin-like protein
LAFTTTTGSGGTSLIGTSGVDVLSLNPATITGSVYIGAQGDNDVLTLQTSTANSYTINLGTGNDTISAAGATSSAIRGDDGNDTITISGQLTTSTVSGLNGIDTITISAGVNGGIVNGNSGSDVISFNNGLLSNNAVIAGGQDGDTINVGNNTNVTLTSGRINGQDGADTITVRNLTASMAIGGASINGGNGSDNLVATAATNGVLMSGDLGNDTIAGGASRDTLFGGDGDDRITGGAAGDSLAGGSGSDYFNVGANVAATGNTLTAGGILATETLTYGQTAATAIDVVTDFVMGAGGDTLDVAGNGGIAPITALGVATATIAAAANTVVYYLSGNYTQSTGVFTIAANGVGGDTLIFTGGATPQASTTSTVLLGTNSSTLTAANFV